MNYPTNFPNILFVIESLSFGILKNIDDYEKNIYNDNDLKRRFYNIDFIYMHSIVLDMGKLLSVVKSDRSTLSELENIAPQAFKVKIQDLRNTYLSIIEKITTNRNKIIAHVDISTTGSYVDLGFSEVEINRKIDDYKEYISSRGGSTPADLDIISRYQKFKSTSSKNERYSPSDFFQEKDTFKKIIEEVLEIARDLNLYFYNLK